LRHYSGEGHLNVGTGEDVSILDLAGLIGDVVGWEGEYVFDPDMPDGVMRKLLDVSRLGEMGWKARIPLDQGLKLTYTSFLAETGAPVEAS
jgi:nucleoside-diphosphate-sugar epimerase